MNAPDPARWLAEPGTSPGLPHELTLLRGLFDLAPLGIQLFDLDRLQPVDCNEALVRLTGRSRRELLETDVQARTPPEYHELRRQWRREVAESGVYGPYETELLHADGHRIAVLQSGTRVTGPDGRRYVWSIIQDMSERKALERQLTAAASQDRLTGLPNRGALTQALARMVERYAHPLATDVGRHGFAVMFLDFDRFKVVNDTLGHEAGDSLLRSIAARLAAALPRDPGSDPDWMAARLGGDEFVILAPGLAAPEAAQRYADGLLHSLAEPHWVKGREVTSNASIGITLGGPDRGDAGALLRDADIAMYEAKRLGRGRHVVFDDRLRQQVTRALGIEVAMREAVSGQQLRLVYQPMVDLESGDPVAVEALLRWQHPSFGLLEPGEFLAVAEESGRIVEMGRWALKRACLDWAVWRREAKAMGRRAPERLSLNISRVQTSDPGPLLATVREALAAADMPAARLVLEVNERDVMKDPAAARELIAALHAMGVSVAMDEFGSGSSSLACLRECPFDAVKIDKSFVTDLAHDAQVMAVAHATVNVIENLGMASVAEGIEDASDLATLQALGCRYGQGWLFGRPVPAGELLAAFGKLG